MRSRRRCRCCCAPCRRQAQPRARSYASSARCAATLLASLARDQRAMNRMIVDARRRRDPSRPGLGPCDRCDGRVGELALIATFRLVVSPRGAGARRKTLLLIQTHSTRWHLLACVVYLHRAGSWCFPAFLALLSSSSSRCCSTRAAPCTAAPMLLVLLLPLLLLLLLLLLFLLLAVGVVLLLGVVPLLQVVLPVGVASCSWLTTRAWRAAAPTGCPSPRRCARPAWAAWWFARWARRPAWACPPRAGPAGCVHCPW